MRKIFSVLLICCVSCLFADNKDEAYTDENDALELSSLFVHYEPPVFEEEDEVSVLPSDGEQESPESAILTLRPFAAAPRFEEEGSGPDQACVSYTHWKRYVSNFGMEKISLAYPQRPAVSQSNTFVTAYAYDHTILYSLTGYFPPLGNIDPLMWFEEVMHSVSHYPYTLISHDIFQVANGDWVLDYTSHDYIQNLIIKARAVVTPFNAYTLQCVKPHGLRDSFDYFLDSFRIKCECNR